MPVAAPILTIAIPVFERVDYFHRALESALSQEVPCEVLVVDNGSSHREFESICARYGARVKYFRNETNIGMFANWNRCFAESRGDFVFLLGDDDLVHPSFSRVLAETVRENPGTDVFYSDIRMLEMGGYYTMKPSFGYPFGLHDGVEILKYAALNGLGCPTVAMAVRREKFSGFFAGFTASNDWYWLYSHARELTFFGVEEPLVAYRKHPAADTRNHHYRNMLSAVGIYLEIEKQLSEHPREAREARRRAHALYAEVRGRAADWRGIVEYYRQDPANPYLRLIEENAHSLERGARGTLAQRSALSARCGARRVCEKVSAELAKRRAVPAWIVSADREGGKR